MSAQNTPQPPNTIPDVPIPTLPTPPPIKTPNPTTIHLRVLIHGEVDVDVPSNTDIDTYSKLIAKDIVKKAPDFKVTKILVAKGLGGPVKVF